MKAVESFIAKAKSKGLSHLVKPKKSEMTMKSLKKTAKTVNETVK